ncbi:MAG: CHAD domain-containing protein [Alphaproteobacteria bacterium]|nr:CHAD domain-containing protein [Alphaproteobacteria bacterium]
MADKKSAIPPVTAAEMRYVLALSVAPEDAARLWQSDLVRGGRLTQRHVSTTYYDTPNQDFRQRTLALSVRREGGRVVEVLEAMPPLAALDGERPCWQAPLTRPVPDLKRFAKVDGVDDLDEAPLRPVFTCRLRRSRTVLEPDGAAVTLSFDEGEIRAAGGRRLPVSEIELELQQGTPRAVFELANALTEEAPLRIELRSKAARGYALAQRGEPRGTPAAPKFGRVALHRSMAAEDALAMILGRCLAHMLANERAASSGTEEGVHQMRVALRRLRVALALFKSMLPDTERQWIIGEVKWLNGALGRARNWDIAAGLVEHVRGGLSDDRDLAALARAVGRERRRAYVALRGVLHARRYALFTLGLLGMIETRAWRRPGALATSILQVSVVGKLADQVLERRYRKARDRVRNFDRLGAVGRHRLRIALKKMRYAAESFASIYPAKAVRRYSKRLARLQDGLGLLNDIASTERLLRTVVQRRPSHALVRGAALVRGWSARVAVECEGELQQGLKRLKKAEPFWRRP